MIKIKRLSHEGNSDVMRQSLDRVVDFIQEV